MKTLMAVLMLGAMLALQPAPAGAYDGITFSLQGQGAGQGKGHRVDRGERRPMRDARTAPPSPPPVEPRRGQLSDDERRQLHRDLDKANRELYRGKR